jgi:hypothetical protein
MSELERLIEDYRTKRQVVRDGEARSLEGVLVGGSWNEDYRNQHAAMRKLADYIVDEAREVAA